MGKDRVSLLEAVNFNNMFQLDKSPNDQVVLVIY
jgi:hypothetical protein